MEREDEDGGSSVVGLVAIGEALGDSDLFPAKEVERNREGRLEGVGACV